MAINFTRLFTTLGKYCGALNELNTFRGTTLSARQTTLATQLVSSAVYGAIVSDVYTMITQAASTNGGYVSALQTEALNVLLAEVAADRPGTGTDKATAVKELRRQMLISAQTLNDCPGSVAVAAVGTPVGLTHQFVFGVYEPVTGKATDYIVPDVYLIQCTADRSQGGTAYAETFSLTGKPADALPTDATYPSGTGLATTLSAVDPSVDQSVVLNGSFDTWTVTNVPDHWNLSSGTVAGTHVFEKVSDAPRGTAPSNISLRLVGDGAQIIKLRQNVTLQPNTVYTVHFRAKKVTDPGADWGVTVRLVDAVAFTAVAGNGSYANSVSTVTCGSMSADWANVVTGVFMTPAVLPVNGIAIEIVLSAFGNVAAAAIAAGEVYVDHVSLIATSPLYDGGPTLAAFSGLTEAVVGDTWTATATLASGVPSTYLIRGIDRLLGLASLGDRIPTVAGGGETQADALVV